MATTSVEGAAMGCYECGSGEPVLFIHGAPTDHRMWLDHCAELADSFRAIALTLRYFAMCC